MARGKGSRHGKFDESKIRRGTRGRFADKPDSQKIDKKLNDKQHKALKAWKAHSAADSKATDDLDKKSLKDLKQLAAEKGITNPTGHKGHKTTWAKAIREATPKEDTTAPKPKDKEEVTPSRKKYEASELQTKSLKELKEIAAESGIIKPDGHAGRKASWIKAITDKPDNPSKVRREEEQTLPTKEPKIEVNKPSRDNVEEIHKEIQSSVGEADKSETPLDNAEQKARSLYEQHPEGSIYLKALDASGMERDIIKYEFDKEKTFYLLSPRGVPMNENPVFNKGIKVLKKDEQDALDNALEYQRKEVEPLIKDLVRLKQKYPNNPDMDDPEVVQVLTRYKKVEAEKVLKESKALETMGGLRDRLISESGISRERALSMAQEVPRTKKLLTKVKNKKVDLEEMNAHLADYIQLTGGRGMSKVKGLTSDDERASFDSTTGLLNVGTKPQKYVIFHEMGHAMELEGGLKGSSDITLYSMSWIRQKSNNTTNAETLNEIEGVKGYDDSERGFRDSFMDPYVGKLYPASTEVISTGTERFTHKEAMLELYKKDKEQFIMTLGALRYGD